MPTIVDIRDRRGARIAAAGRSIFRNWKMRLGTAPASGLGDLPVDRDFSGSGRASEGYPQGTLECPVFDPFFTSGGRVVFAGFGQYAIAVPIRLSKNYQARVDSSSRRAQ